MQFIKSCALVLFSVLCSIMTMGQSLSINEIAYEEWFFPDNEGDFGWGWIELKNTSSVAINSSNLLLIANNLPPWPLPDAIIQPEEYLFIWLTGKNRNLSKDDLHTSFTITDDYNVFKVYDAVAQRAIDSVTVFTRPYWNESRSRYPENTNDWYNSENVTPGYANAPRGLWRRVSTFSQFAPRDSSPNAALFFNNKFWIFSGWEGAPEGGVSVSTSNVWSSETGSDWVLINPTPPYNPYSSYVVFQNAMWAFDGSAFKSYDGITWDKVSENLPFKTNCRVVAFNSGLIAVNGKSVYQSEDGVVWHQVTNDAPWEYREFPALVAFKDKVWLFGGGINYFTGNDRYFDDVWCSSDGVSWTLVTHHAEWAGRLWFGYAAFDNKMWLLGGWNYHDKEDANYGNKNDVWYSENGYSWKELVSANMWRPRHAPFVWSTPTGLFLSSGFLNNYALFNDVWKLSALSSGDFNRFYLKPDAALSKTESWGSNADGSGPNPVGFDFDYQEFVLSNSDSIILESDWTVDGDHSRIMFGDGEHPIYIELREGVDISGTAELQAKSTLVLLGNQRTPTIRNASIESSIFIQGGEVSLDATEIGNLTIMKSSVDVLKPSEVKGSISLEEGASLSSPYHSFQYKPSAVLTYNQIDDYSASEVEWPTKSAPGKVIVNCNCTITKSGDTMTDTLVFYNGLLKISNGTLFLDNVRGISDSTYIVTAEEGFLTLSLNRNEITFPIGTEDTYNPISIRLKNDPPQPDLSLSSRVFVLDTLRYLDYAVNRGWHVKDENGEPSVKYELTVQWERSSLGISVPPQTLAFKTLKDGTWVSTAGLTQEDFFPEKNAFVATSSLESYGVFSLQSIISESKSSVAIYPNPVTDYLQIALREPTQEAVQINLYSATGAQVFSLAGEAGQTRFTIPFARDFLPGIYILQIVYSNKVFTEKISHLN